MLQIIIRWNVIHLSRISLHYRYAYYMIVYTAMIIDLLINVLIVERERERNRIPEAITITKKIVHISNPFVSIES